jgi:hypothetical protein
VGQNRRLCRLFKCTRCHKHFQYCRPKSRVTRATLSFAYNSSLIKTGVSALFESITTEKPNVSDHSFNAVTPRGRRRTSRSNRGHIGLEALRATPSCLPSQEPSFCSLYSTVGILDLGPDEMLRMKLLSHLLAPSLNKWL